MYVVLLVAHIAGGVAALLGAAGAVGSQGLGLPHRWHAHTGIMFVWGMAAVVLTAIPMSLLRFNLFLLLIALFSGYLVWSGLRYARRRNGPVTHLDRGAAQALVAVGAGMLLLGAGMLFRGDGLAVVLLVFGGLSLLLGRMDLDAYRSGLHSGRERIANHLRMMLGGTIAAATAFATTAISTGPPLLAWLGPTVLITPLIVYWSRRVLVGGWKAST